jgi:predicted RNA-binding protein with PIN domain
MKVHFARRHSDADELIEELLEDFPAPRELLVVSSDHRVQRAARRRGADFIDSDKWYAEVRAVRQRRQQDGEIPTAKSQSDISNDEIAYWVDEFADAPSDNTATNPFPPGYAEDIVDEE